MPDTIEINITQVNNTVTVNVTNTALEVEVNAYATHPGANIIVSDTEPVDPGEGLVWIGPL